MVTAPPVNRDDPRWQRIRAAITFTSSSIVADRHADFVYRIVERIPEPDKAQPKSKPRRKPARPVRRPFAPWCDDCNSMGYQPGDGTCTTCGGRGTLPPVAGHVSDSPGTHTLDGRARAGATKGA